jgi:hypothetical protein
MIQYATGIKADIGGIGGHTRPSDELVQAVKDFVAKNSKGMLIDHYIGYAGDDIHIVMTHTRGVDDEKIHKLARVQRYCQKRRRPCRQQADFNNYYLNTSWLQKNIEGRANCCKIFSD